MYPHKNVAFQANYPEIDAVLDGTWDSMLLRMMLEPLGVKITPNYQKIELIGHISTSIIIASSYLSLHSMARFPFNFVINQGHHLWGRGLPPGFSKVPSPPSQAFETAIIYENQYIFQKTFSFNQECHFRKSMRGRGGAK